MIYGSDLYACIVTMNMQLLAKSVKCWVICTKNFIEGSRYIATLNP